MKRVGMFLIAVTAVVTMACGGTDSAGSSTPTAPSSSGGGSSQPSNSSNVPTNLRVAVSGSSVTLSWNGVNNATEYLVLVGTTSGSSDKLSTNTTHTDYTWTVGSGTYYARVQAKVNGTFGSSSNEVAFTIS